MTTTTGLAAISAQMENIGRNCEFGLAQRDAGAESVGLLRWAGTPRASLIDGLRNRFTDLAEEMTGKAEPPNHPPEQQNWWLTCKRYGILFHTGEGVTKGGPEAATAAVRMRLRWLAAKLIDDIAAAEKLFVFSDATMVRPDDALDLLDAMRDIGPAWLWSVAQNKRVTGTMVLNEGLIGSWVPQLTDAGNATEYSRSTWPHVIRQAYRTWAKNHPTSQRAPARASRSSEPSAHPAP